MTIFRFIFYIYYKSSLINFYFLAKAFYMGMRFDLVIIAYINALVSLSILLVWVSKKVGLFSFWQKAVKFYYTFMYSLVFIILCVDFGFYSYFKNHINILIFGVFEDDTKALFSTIAQNYNVVLLAASFAALIILIYFACRYFINSISVYNNSSKEYKVRYKIGFVMLLLSMNFIAARGSFGMFPLGIMDAEISPDTFINKLSLNGIFTLQDALNARMNENKDYNIIKTTGYENNILKAFSDFLGKDTSQLNKDFPLSNLIKRTKKNIELEKIKPNVIVIMMEGFGTDLLHYNCENFNVLGELKKHFDSDILFSNFLSGDVGTIGSLETVLLSIPKRPQAKAVTQSRYAFNTYQSGAAIPYKKTGYDTVFLYGGNMGWRNVLTFVPRLGFDTIEGEGAMDSKYLRNQWGVYDEYLFDYIYKKLSNNNSKSKFIFALSTSNHPPYSLPPSYKQLPLEITDELNSRITGDKKLAMGRFMTYQYANQKLGELISKIKSSEFGKNTIIAVTGDHNFWSVFDYKKEQMEDLVSVPFYIYVPEKFKPSKIDNETFGSHIDIMSTLYNLSLSDQEYLSTGSDMFDNTAVHAAYNVDWIAMNNEGAVKYYPENNSASCFKWSSAGKRVLVETDETDTYKKILNRYKATLAVTEYILRNPVMEKK